MSKEKRSLLGMIFGNKKQTFKQTHTTLEMLNSYKAVYTTLGEGTYESKVARQCIDRIATHCAKLIPKHIKEAISNEIKGDINYLLQNQPNPLMSKYDFIYKVISSLYTDSNTFIYIAKDEDGMITGFYPILSTFFELLQDNSNNIYLKFQFINGKTYILPYLELIHLRLFYNRHDILGDDNSVLKTDLETAHTASEGLKNAIKLSTSLKGILKYENAMLKAKDLKDSRDNFVKDFIDMENESGIATLDSKAEFKEVNIKPITLDKDQLKQVNNNIFDYFGVSEKIINNSFSEEEWNAFYEGVIEPRAIQMSDAFTNKIFSKKARKDGNKVVFTANRMQYASLSNKINLLKEAGALGLLTKDEAREIIDLHPLGGTEGAKIIQSLNNINSDIADQYQGGE